MSIKIQSIVHQEKAIAASPQRRLLLARRPRLPTHGLRRVGGAAEDDGAVLLLRDDQDDVAIYARP